MLSLLDASEDRLRAGFLDRAVSELQLLRHRVDGCGSTAVQNDWIRDCTDPFEIRRLIDLLIANLGS